MKYILFTLLLFLSLNFFSQKSIDDGKSNQFGLYFSVNKSKVYQKNGTFSFSTGINYLKKYQKTSMRLNLGLQYSFLTYKSDKFLNQLKDTFKISYYKVSFVDLPIKYNEYVYESNTFSAYLSCGLSFSSCISHYYEKYFYLSETGKEIYREPRENIPIYYELFLGISLGIGFEYKFKNDLSISFEPEVNGKISIDIIDGGSYGLFSGTFGLRKSF